MIHYMVGNLALNPTHSTRRGLVKYVPGKGYFRAVPSQNGDKFVTSPPPSIVERVTVGANAAHTATTTLIISLGCSGDYEMTPASSA